MTSDEYKILKEYFNIGRPLDLFAKAMVVLTVAALLVLGWKGRTDPAENVKRVRAVRRKTEVV
jgi:hypothetical protein